MAPELTAGAARARTATSLCNMLVQQRRMVDGSGKRACSESQVPADDEPRIRGEVGCLRFRFGDRPAPSRVDCSTHPRSVHNSGDTSVM